MKLEGKVWRYGDNIDTGVIISGTYSFSHEPLVLAAHAMENLDPQFSSKVSQGDIIVAGNYFGCGSSREAAPLALKEAGIAAIVAISFSRTFFRNAINVGLPVIECTQACEIQEGENIAIDLASGTIIVKESGKVLLGTVLPDFLMEIIEAGGLVPYERKHS